MPFWAIVFLGNCLSGQMFFRANIFWANVFLGKCLSGQMSFWGQMSPWTTIVWANVSGQMYICKYRMGKRHRTDQTVRGLLKNYDVHLFLESVCFGSNFQRVPLRTCHLFRTFMDELGRIVV
jgi:hypothetical protein